MTQHLIFIKYTREWLHQVTGYSKGFLSRVATGKVPLSRPFIERTCLRLNEPEAELFLPEAVQLSQCLLPGGCSKSDLSQWLEERCKREHLSLRQVAAKTGLSHGTISDIIKGSQPLPETIKKLARGFGGDGKQRLALEDKLLVLAGCRTERPGEELSEPLAQLIDKVRQFNEPQIKMMLHFADFLVEMEERRERLRDSDYVRGYQEVPESAEEVEAVHRVGIAVLAGEPGVEEIQ